ncbi:MAG: SAF domain-containing protein [Myxococcota bacterium]
MRAFGTTLGLGLLGVLFGLVVGAVLFVAIESALQVRDGVIARQRRIEDTVMVMVAARDVRAGHVWTEEDLVAIEMPTALWLGSWVDDPELVVGMRVTADTLTNEFVRTERMALPEGEGDAAKLALLWSLRRCSEGVGGTEGCGGVRAPVEALIRAGRNREVGDVAERLDRLHLYPAGSPVLAALHETGTATGPLPPARTDLSPWRLTLQFDHHHDHRRGCERAKLGRDPALPPLVEREVQRADRVEALSAWAGDALDDAALQKWGSGAPFVECDGAVSLTVERLAAIWEDPAPQSSR